jgi:hypothetical protein
MEFELTRDLSKNFKEVNKEKSIILRKKEYVEEFKKLTSLIKLSKNK